MEALLLRPHRNVTSEGTAGVTPLCYYPARMIVSAFMILTRTTAGGDAAPVVEMMLFPGEVYPGSGINFTEDWQHPVWWKHYFYVRIETIHQKVQQVNHHSATTHQG